MTRDLAINLLRQGETGEQILQILDTVVEDFTSQNIDDAAQHYAEISMPTLESVEF